MWNKNIGYELLVNDVVFNLDFDFIIKKTTGLESDFKHEFSLYNINNFDIENIKLKKNGIVLFEGEVLESSIYTAENSTYTNLKIKEVILTEIKNKINFFLQQKYFFKTQFLNDFFTVEGLIENFELEKEVLNFDESQGLETRIKYIIQNSNYKNEKYFYNKKQNKISFFTKNTVAETLTIINSSKTQNKQKTKKTFIKEVSLKCIPNFFLNPLDTIFFQDDNYFIEDITITGGTTQGYIMDVYATNNLIKDEELDYE